MCCTVPCWALTLTSQAFLLTLTTCSTIRSAFYFTSSPETLPYQSETIPSKRECPFTGRTSHTNRADGSNGFPVREILSKEDNFGVKHLRLTLVVADSLLETMGELPFCDLIIVNYYPPNSEIYTSICPIRRSSAGIGDNVKAIAGDQPAASRFRTVISGKLSGLILRQAARISL